jgi:hypothetical protein
MNRFVVWGVVAAASGILGAYLYTDEKLVKKIKKFIG